MSTAAALASGITRRQLGSPRFVHLMRGVVVPADERVTVSTWVDAARIVLGPDAVAIGRTALQMRGVDVGELLPVKMATPTRVRTTIPQISVVWRSGIDGPGGMQPLRDAIIAEVGVLPVKDAVATCDRVLYKRLAKPQDLARWATETRGHVARASPSRGWRSRSPRHICACVSPCRGCLSRSRR